MSPIIQKVIEEQESKSTFHIERKLLLNSAIQIIEESLPINSRLSWAIKFIDEYCSLEETLPSNQN